MWYMTEGKDSDVVLNSRVTLHRNLEDYPFSDQMTDDQAAALVEAVKAVYADGEGWSATDLAAMSEEERRATAEQHVISRALAGREGPVAAEEAAEQVPDRTERVCEDRILEEGIEILEKPVCADLGQLALFLHRRGAVVAETEGALPAVDVFMEIVSRFVFLAFLTQHKSSFPFLIFLIHTKMIIG